MHVAHAPQSHTPEDVHWIWFAAGVAKGQQPAQIGEAPEADVKGVLTHCNAAQHHILIIFHTFSAPVYNTCKQTPLALHTY
jgi:hypothetical protein